MPINSLTFLKSPYLNCSSYFAKPLSNKITKLLPSILNFTISHGIRINIFFTYIHISSLGICKLNCWIFLHYCWRRTSSFAQDTSDTVQFSTSTNFADICDVPLSWSVDTSISLILQVSLHRHDLSNHYPLMIYSSPRNSYLPVRGWAGCSGQNSMLTEVTLLV